MSIPKYTIQKLGIQTNGEQLRVNRQRLLRQFIDVIYYFNRQSYEHNQLKNKRSDWSDTRNRYDNTDAQYNVNVNDYQVINKIQNDKRQDKMNNINMDINNININPQQLSQFYSILHPTSSKNIHSQLLKKSLLSELSNQIASKNYIKNLSLYKQKQHQHNLTKHIKQLQLQQVQKQRNYKKNFKQEALEHIRFNEAKKCKKNK